MCPASAELTLTLRELAAQIAPHGTFNFLLGNGLALWAYASTNLYHVERKHPFALATLSEEDLSVNFAGLCRSGPSHTPICPAWPS